MLDLFRVFDDFHGGAGALEHVCNRANISNAAVDYDDLHH